MIDGAELVDGDRWADYGEPCIAWDRIAEAWSVIAGRTLEARQCVAMMICMKVVRQVYGPKEDNLADIEGYTEILRRLDRRNA